MEKIIENIVKDAYKSTGIAEINFDDSLDHLYLCNLCGRELKEKKLVNHLVNYHRLHHEINETIAIVEKQVKSLIESGHYKPNPPALALTIINRNDGF